MTIRIAGIGPRNITPEGIALVHHVAEQLASLGYHLNSGHGSGADQAWAFPFPDAQKQIFIPWWGFNGALPNDNSVFKLSDQSITSWTLAEQHHPSWRFLTHTAKALMLRNVSIMLTGTLIQAVDACVYWQLPDVKLSAKGGTQHGLRVAQYLHIPCFNINTEEGQIALDEWVSSQ